MWRGSARGEGFRVAGDALIGVELVAMDRDFGE
jgi:hypothetical protein